jgi:excisionase family DNA binding protein
MRIEITLTDEQLDTFADLVAARLKGRIKEAKKPLTVSEFAKASSLSNSQIYRWVEAGKIRRVEGLAKVLIPASQLDRFQ